jgi:hypothetical protein
MTLMNSALLSSVGLLFGILLFHEVGWRLGGYPKSASKPGGASSGLLEGAIYGLLGLLIAFTFSGAASRFDHRRELVIEETNAIGTAYLRLDLLPADAQPVLRTLFRQYLDARLDTYRKLPDWDASQMALARSRSLQDQIWPMAVKACQGSGSVPTTTLLLNALNEMFDIATLRNTVAMEMHPPLIIFLMLFSLALISAGLAGFTAAGAVGRRNWVPVLAFAFITAGTVYAILDIEYPRMGLIRVDSVDRVMIDLRNSM